MPFWRLYYHLVWATKRREPLITPAIETLLYQVVGSKSIEKRAQVFAVNGMPDHIHLVAAIPPSIALSDFVKFVKGASSHVMQSEFDMSFGWQRGYGAFSISQRNLPRVIEYVEQQKEHHRADKVIPAFERFSQGDEGPVTMPPMHRPR